MRTKVVTVNEKTITIKEKRLGELELLTKDLYGKLGKIAKMQVEDVLKDGKIFAILYDNLNVLFPELTKDDLKNAYMSEIEELIQGFIDVNFFGIKKLIPQLMTLIQVGSAQK